MPGDIDTDSLKLLITGSKGQLGNELRRCLDTMAAEIGDIPKDYANAQVKYVDYDTLDITNDNAVDSYISNFNPDIVINCAAFTNVDGCEQEEAKAYAVNAEGPANLARSCDKCGAKLVHISTDYVFPGSEPGERIETDETGPISAYGRTKHAGELAVFDALERAFVIRTAWLYGYVGKNFVKTMRNLGQSRSQITVVDDQLGNPTSANDLAYEILKIALTDNYGVYHCTNNGTVSWAQFANAIMDGLNLDCEVIPVTSIEYKSANPASADRPAYSSLKNKHLEQTIGDEMREWDTALATYLKNLPELEGQ